jgi:hypothetical protein
MTDLDIYQPGIVEPTRLAMTPEAAKQLDDQLRACTRAVLRRGVDYGQIPGTDGKDILLKPGAEKLLQWFGFAYTMECLDIERDDDGKKWGVTYRCGIVKRLSDGSIHALAACEGYAGYEEPKFYKSAEQNQAEAKAKELGWAKQYKRDPVPAKWEFVGEYRAPWNTVVKRAQKRALVGATINATAAGGLFSEGEEPGPVPEDDGPTLYQQMLAAAGNFKTVDAGNKLWNAAENAATAGRINLRQATNIKNKIKPRREMLRKTVAVEVEDLADKAEADYAQAAAEDPQPEPADDTLPVEDPPEDWPQAVKPGTGQPKGK